MKKFLLSLLCCGSLWQGFAQDAYFMAQPSLTPDGKEVVFTFEGDIWKASVADGIAVRLTAMQGNETNPRVSPDGKWIAFTGRQYGNADVFIMPVTGGEITPLTVSSYNDEIESWGWDSKTVYFSSNRAGNISAFKVGINGGTPERILGAYYFQFDHNISQHPATGDFYFNNTWESSNQLHRKRYKGPFNPDVQSYNPQTKVYKKYTTWEGKDFGATIDKNGNIYYLSDQGTGEYNLFTLVNGTTPKALTKGTVSLKGAQVNANGGKVVYQKDYQLFIYDVVSGKESKIPVKVIRNSVLPVSTDYRVGSSISYFDASPDGKKLAFISRGELFVSDVEGKFIQQIERSSTERVKEVKWLEDNRTLLFTQTLNGYTNLYTIAADNSEQKPKELTKDKQNNRGLVFNNKRTHAVYYSGRNEVRLLDLKKLTGKTVAKEELWGFYNVLPDFSPDGDYILFTAYIDFEQDIFVHHISANKTYNLSNSGVTETNPAWSPDGKYIYFHSNRLKPSYPRGLENPSVYRLPLVKINEPFRSNKFDELFAQPLKDTTNKKDSTKKEVAKKDSVSSKIVIDFNQLMKRVEQVSPGFGSQALVGVYGTPDKTQVLYTSNQADGRWALYKKQIVPFESDKTEKINGTDGNTPSQIVVTGGKYYALIGGQVNKLNLDGNRVDPISIQHTFRRNLAAEFAQIFEESWAQMEENFYNGDFHGIDWNKMKKYYQQFVPHLNNRADLRVLLNDLLGELNSSHIGFSSFGMEESVPFRNVTIETGIVFQNNAPYKVDRILEGTALDKDGIQLQQGDELVQVNGTKVDTKKNRYSYFTFPSPEQEMALTFLRAGKEIKVKVHPQMSIGNNLYDEWIEKNQQYVNSKSNNKIAYGYMKNMGAGELDNFIIDMTQELNSKDALILDLRYNTGGNVHDDVLRFLSQRTYLNWKYRDGKLSPQSNFAPGDKPIVLLINEQSLSDAEMTAAGFKALKLGTIIGNATYRWIIFTSGVGMVDGSSIRMPAWGCYTKEGDNLEVTGVTPDILVINSFEDNINNRDLQLDKAISEILKQLKK